MSEHDTPAMRAQGPVVTFIEDGGLGPVERRIDTAAAIVFLTAERAYKIKRAVRFSFLDFASIAKREAALRAELRLNRRTAPDLYLAVRAITRRGPGFELDGDGELVDWLLEMRRFADGARLDEVARRGAFEAALVDALADAILAFHRDAEAWRDRGGAAEMAGVIDGNALDLRSLAGSVFARPAIEALIKATSAEWRAVESLLDARMRKGFVRHCHGDLHLRNIALIEGVPVPFDCLEFDETLAVIDVLYDLAFLVMDLIVNDLRAEARGLLERYAFAAGESEGLRAMPFFLSLRATIRAKVTGLAVGPAADAERACLIEEARTYLALATTFLEPEPRRLLAVGGLSGTGKTTLAMALAPLIGPLPGAFVLRSDVIRKELFGVDPLEALPPTAYTSEVSQKVYAIMNDRAARYLRAGRSVICDAVFGTADEREAVEALAARLRVPFDGIWLETPAFLNEARLAGRTSDASDADVDVFRKQRQFVEVEHVEWSRHDASGPAAELAGRIRAAIMQSGADEPSPIDKRG